MSVDSSYVCALFQIENYSNELTHYFLDDDKFVPKIVETLHHLDDAGFIVSEVYIGKPGIIVSRAAIETILTLNTEQAIGWISVVWHAVTAH